MPYTSNKSKETEFRKNDPTGPKREQRSRENNIGHQRRDLEAQHDYQPKLLAYGCNLCSHFLWRKNNNKTREGKF